MRMEMRAGESWRVGVDVVFNVRVGPSNRCGRVLWATVLNGAMIAERHNVLKKSLYAFCICHISSVKILKNRSYLFFFSTHALAYPHAPFPMRCA